ncbi:MAG: ATP-dependent Clp protease ATP-binding subunit ClpX [Lachnospiraceae bacterium]|nr:ATP-dependent Clp protease ATP-binding subunit ClpX [Lachnospiraceae bacterium]
MGDKNNNVEEFCMVCRRGKSAAGELFKLPNNLRICQDCLRNVMDQVSKLDGSSVLSGVFPAGMGFPDASAFQIHIQNTDNNPAGEAAVNDGVDSIASQQLITDQSKAAEGEVSQDGDKKGDKKDSNENKKNGFPNIQFMNLSDFGFGMPFQGQRKIKETSTEDILKEFDFESMPKPHKIKELLDEYVVGQEKAKKVISVAVYNHYKRVREELSGKEDKEKNRPEIEKSNILLLGPTGCGKTHLVKTLARIMKVPLAIADATSLTEAGYIGDDIESVISKLLTAADNDVGKAECGIVFVDEIDKISKKRHTNSRDVSGESVQQGMLKLLEGSEVEVPIGANSKNAMVPLAKVNTRNILFICGGAFPDLEQIIKERLRKETSIGFNAELKDKWDKEKDILEKVAVEDLKKFGMIPEFIGRLPIICPMLGLTEDMMVRILREPRNAIMKQYQRLLEMDEVKLEFTDGALYAIAKKAMENETGARALRAVMEEYMLDIMYEVPKDPNIGVVTITESYIEGNGGPVIDLRNSMARPMPEDVA